MSVETSFALLRPYLAPTLAPSANATTSAPARITHVQNPTTTSAADVCVHANENDSALVTASPNPFDIGVRLLLSVGPASLRLTRDDPTPDINQYPPCASLSLSLSLYHPPRSRTYGRGVAE
jgi:hypothetical protein